MDSLQTDRKVSLVRRRLALIAMVLLIAGGSTMPLLADSPKERFKALLQSPPVIERLVFVEKLPVNPHHAVPLDQGIAASTNFQTFELRWQTNAMFLRQIRNLNDLTNQFVPGECFTLWNDQFYFLDAGRKAMLYVLEQEKARAGIYPPPYHATLIKRGKAAEVLNLGISHLTPGSIRWEGDTFHAVSTADKKPIHIRGEISGLTNGIPIEMKVQYSNDVSVANYRMTYAYESYRPPYYPTRITAHFINRDKEIEYRAYSILSLATSPNPLPQSRFGPEPFLLANAMPTFYLTNDSIFFKLPSGQLIETPATIPKLRLSGSDFFKNRYYYFAAASVTLWFLALVLRTKAQTEKTSFDLTNNKQNDIQVINR